MKTKNRVLPLATWFMAFLFLAGGSIAFAQEKFPSRPITFIIPWAAGGGGTVNAQKLQPDFEKAIRGSIQIVNKAGGGGTIGWNALATAPPDGYTVGVANQSWVITQYTTKTGVPLKKLDPIIMVIDMPGALAVRADAPWKTLKEFIAHAKANPGKVQVGNSGMGANFHIAALGLEMASGVKFTHVPFKGAGPTIPALLGGHVDATIIELPSLVPFVEGKKFRLLAVGSPQRMKAVPDVPTTREQGYDIDLVGAWYVWCAPKGVPKDRIKALHDAFKVAMESKEYNAFYEKEGGLVRYMGPDSLPAFLEQQDKILKKIIDYSGFKAID